jgi:ABC-2 type transport system ATP-binding protein
VDAIVIDHLTKTIKPNWPWIPPTIVLRGLSFSVGQGEIFGFLGPNGAGKTTTLKILIGLIRQTSGRAEVLGSPAGNVDVHRRIGFLPESPYFYDYLTAEEFLRFYGRLAGLDGVKLSQRVTALLETLSLTEARNRQLRKFSKGMLQRIGLAQALIHDPELVIFDEPMSGLDPLGRKEVRDLILHLREQGKTVFFSTHIIPDVEMICDRVAVIVKGEVVAAGRVDELVGHGRTRSVEVVCEGLRRNGLHPMQRLASRVVDRGTQCLIVLPEPDRLDEAIAAIRSGGGRLISVTPQKGSLEELFVQQVQLKA